MIQIRAPRVLFPHRRARIAPPTVLPGYEGGLPLDYAVVLQLRDFLGQEPIILHQHLILRFELLNIFRFGSGGAGAAVGLGCVGGRLGLGLAHPVFVFVLALSNALVVVVLCLL